MQQVSADCRLKSCGVQHLVLVSVSAQVFVSLSYSIHPHIAHAYLLLCAVDVFVAKRMHKLGVQQMLAGCPVVLCLSSHHELLQSTQEVVVLSPDGTVSKRGTLEEVQKGLVPSGQIEDVTEPQTDQELVELKADQEPDAGALTITETKQTGSISRAVYRDYFEQAAEGRGSALCWLLIVLYSLGQLARVGSDLWLTWYAPTERTLSHCALGCYDVFYCAMLSTCVLSSTLVLLLAFPSSASQLLCSHPFGSGGLMGL